MTSRPYCAIDFGTSNSAVAIAGARRAGVRTGRAGASVHRHADRGVLRRRRPGRTPGAAAAVRPRRDRGLRRRHRRPPDALDEEHPRLRPGRAAAPTSAAAVRCATSTSIGGYLRAPEGQGRGTAPAARSHARCSAGRCSSSTTSPSATPQAQSALERAAREVGFVDVQFQYEPIAAAFDHEQRVDREQTVLVADIGGGTSDFSRRARRARAAHAARPHAATSWPTTACTWPAPTSTAASSWRCMLPLARLRRVRPAAAPTGAAPREVPSGDLLRPRDLAPDQHRATRRRASPELRGMRDWYADERLHRAPDDRPASSDSATALGARAEDAKIAVSSVPAAPIDMNIVEDGLATLLRESQAMESIGADRGTHRRRCRRSPGAGGIEARAPRRDVLHRRLHRAAAAGGGDRRGGTASAHRERRPLLPAWPRAWACMRGACSRVRQADARRCEGAAAQNSRPTPRHPANFHVDGRPRRQDLDGRRTGRLARRQDPRADAHAALRLRRLRRRARLQHGQRHGDLPPARAHRAPVQQRQDPAHEDPVQLRAGDARRSATWCAPTSSRAATCARSPGSAPRSSASAPKGNTIHLMVAAWAWGAYLGEEGLKRGIRVKTSSYTRHHVNITMTQAKAVSNYTNSILANMEATRRRLRRGAAARRVRLRQRGRRREPVRHQGRRGLHARPVGRRAQRHHAQHRVRDLRRTWASRSSRSASPATRSTSPTRPSSPAPPPR